MVEHTASWAVIVEGLYTPVEQPVERPRLLSGGLGGRLGGGGDG